MTASEIPSDWQPAQTPLAILADGCFGAPQSKFALGVVRYGQWPVAAVIDASQAGKTVRQVTQLPCDAPVVDSLAAALTFQPKALLIGTAPPGGQLPESWRAILADAIRHGLHLINGLHFFLNEEPTLVALAQEHGVRLWDVRDPEAYGRHRFQVINTQPPRPAALNVVAMVGTDCSVGKMCTALELHAGAEKRGLKSAFVATGQTGIVITGRGVPLDRVIGDFMAGAVDGCIQDELRQDPAPEVVFVEGQGSLLHPAYSGVTLSLLHGANPDAMILCHQADAATIRHYPHLPLPPLAEFARLYEEAARWVRPPGVPPARVAGIAVNTSMWPSDRAQEYLAQVSAETGLPATDPVRFGVDGLLDALG